VKLLLALLAAYGVYAAAAFLAQRWLIFPAALVGPGLEHPERIPGLEQNWLETPAGLTEAWFLLPTGGAIAGVRSPVMIFAHGNAERIDHWPRGLQTIRDAGVAVLLVEYPGYGRSAGSPSQASITVAMVAAYDWVASRADVDADRIFAYGRSLGGGAACALSQERSLAALVLQSTFTSVRPFAARMFLPSFLVRDPFDNLAAVRAFEGPILVAHGRQDDVIPYTHGVALSHEIRTGRFLSYDAAHNDFPRDPREYWSDVAGFLGEHGVL
jgi:fermentation-respiration switch protein FrsA (DUF1100 family)